MDVAALLQRIQSRLDYAGQLVHVEALPERAGRYAAIPIWTVVIRCRISRQRSVCSSC